MSSPKSKPSVGRLRGKSLSEVGAHPPETPTSPLSPVSLKSRKSNAKLRKKTQPPVIIPAIIPGMIPPIPLVPMPATPAMPTTPTTPKAPKSPKLSSKASFGILRRRAMSQGDVPPLPPIPAAYATTTTPTHISQWESNVNRLSKTERDRALLTASAVSHNLSTGGGHNLHRTLRAFKDQEVLRDGADDADETASTYADLLSWPIVGDPQIENQTVQEREVGDSEGEVEKAETSKDKAPGSTPWPIWESPPHTPNVIPRVGPTIRKSSVAPEQLPPQQAESLVEKRRPQSTPHFPTPDRPSSPRNRMIYEELLDNVDIITLGIEKEGRISKVDAAVKAASRVLDMVTEEFDKFYSLSQPANTHDRMEKYRHSGTYPQRESVELPSSAMAIMWATKILGDKEVEQQFATQSFDITTEDNTPSHPKEDNAPEKTLAHAEKDSVTLERKATMKRLASKRIPRHAEGSSSTSVENTPLESPVEEEGSGETEAPSPTPTEKPGPSDRKVSVESVLASLTQAENPDDVTTRQKGKAPAEYRKSSLTLAEDLALQEARKGEAPVELREMSPDRLKDLPVTKRRIRKVTVGGRSVVQILENPDITKPSEGVESTASRESSHSLKENPDVVKLLERKSSTDSARSTATVRRADVVKSPREKIEVEKRRQKGHAPDMTEFRSWSDSLREMGLDIEGNDEEEVQEEEEEEEEEEDGGFF